MIDSVLDKTGLNYLWGKIKAVFASKDEIATIAKGSARLSAIGVGQGSTSSSDIVYARFGGITAGHTYRLYIQKTPIDVTGISYASSGYLRFVVTVRDTSDASILSVVALYFDTTTSVAPYYDIVIPSTMTTADHIRIAFRAASGFEEWFQLEDVTEHIGYSPNIKLIGQGNTIAYSEYYKGVKGGRKYRLLFKSPNIDMSGVTNTNSRLIIYRVNLANIVLDTTTQVVRWNKADSLPNYYDVTIPNDGVDYALCYCMRATDGAEQILEVEDITDIPDSPDRDDFMFNSMLARVDLEDDYQQSLAPQTYYTLDISSENSGDFVLTARWEFGNTDVNDWGSYYAFNDICAPQTIVEVHTGTGQRISIQDIEGNPVKWITPAIGVLDAGSYYLISIVDGTAGIVKLEERTYA